MVGMTPGHHIQRRIILDLAKATRLRYSELKPRELESNSFMYHLKELMKRGLVEQHNDKSYSLTPSGVSYFDSVTLTNNQPRRQPKIICILIVRDNEGRYLFAKRKMQPNINTWMLPSGKQHFGESVSEHAIRELNDQIGIDAIPARAGVADIRLNTRGELVTHLMANVYATTYTGKPPDANDRFEYSWIAKDELDDATPGTRDLIEAFESSDNFALELDLEFDS